MELYVITTEYSDIPLAEIRTDGKSLEFVVDNTNGKLPASLGNDFSRLKQIISKSHHLRMSHPQGATLGLLRYSLENGDIIEVTTDGKSCLLNGSLLQEQEKDALFYAIANGHLKVKEKADLSKPIPILPKIQPAPMKKESQNDKEYIKALNESRQQKEKDNAFNSSKYDRRIESIDFSDMHNPALSQDLLYMLKYGTHKG
jgi:hypothetical protein